MKYSLSEDKQTILLDQVYAKIDEEESAIILHWYEDLELHSLALKSMNFLELQENPQSASNPKIISYLWKSL